MKISAKVGNALLIAIMAIFLLIPAIHSTYPLVTSDSGTYIGSGFYGTVPIDRPMLYSLFLYFLSFKYSIWIPILVQGLILAYLLFQLLKVFLEGVSNKMIYLFFTLCLSTTTGVAWYASQIMSDVFIGISFLALALLLFKDFKKVEKVFIILFYLLGLCTHNSHLLVFTIVCMVVGLLVFINLFKVQHILNKRRVYQICAITFGAWLINPCINLIYEKKFHHSGSPYAFLVAKYCENGILQQYVKEKCAIKPNQKQQVDEGAYYFKNVKSHLFLDVEGYSMFAGAKIHQWEYTGIENQKFFIEKAQNDFVRIKSAKSSLYVTVTKNAEGKFALQQDSLDQHKNQLFQINMLKKPNIVNLSVAQSQTFLASDTVNNFLGMQFITCNAKDSLQAQFELVNGTNCFCFYQDSLPKGAMEFLWHPRSIFSRTGNWAFHEKEYKPIIHDIIFSPSYFKRNAAAALGATIQQLSENDIGDGLAAYDVNSSPYFNLNNTIPRETDNFLHSEQNKGQLHFIFLNFLIQKMMALSFIAIVLILLVPYLRKRIHTKLLLLTLIMLITLVANAFVTGAMANILDRLQSRISWILPLMAMILIYNLVQQFQNESKP